MGINDKKPHIVLVEDDNIMAKTLKEELSDNGFEVSHAVDGESGLKMIVDEHPDLVLLDIILPKISGIQVLKQLRENEDTKNIKVITLTNLSNSETVANAIQNGSYGYLVKSDWKLPDLVDKVKKVLEVGQ